MTQLPDTSTEQGQREASVMLARLMGLAPQLFSDVCNFYHEDTYDIFVSIYPHGWYHGMTKDEAWKYFPNLYDPANMALAWRVLNWAMSCDHLLPEQASSIIWIKYRIGVRQFNLVLSELVDMDYASTLSPSEAMRYWLDKILTLAIEAGMIT